MPQLTDPTTEVAGRAVPYGRVAWFFMTVHTGSGIPRRALALNLAVIVVFLLPFSGWQQIVSVMGEGTPDRTGPIGGTDSNGLPNGY